MGDVDAQLQQMRASIERLVTANETLINQVNSQEQKIQQLKKESEDKEEKLNEEKTAWLTLNTKTGELLVELKAQREEIVNAGGTEDYLKETTVFREEGAFDGLWDLMPDGATAEPAARPGPWIKQEHVMKEITTPQEPFMNTGREEKLDLSFGNECTGKALRRFMDKYRVVKQLNVAAGLTGWDQPEYRANKLKLALQGEAFDYVSFESTMPNRKWKTDDEEILVKLQDRYQKIQAVELHILEYEKSAQEPKEPLSEFLSRIQRLAADAYDGDSEPELVRKLAWRFVTGIRSESIRKKLMEFGWMKTRREAKPLDELLKVAEIAKMTEEAVKSTGPERNCSVNAFQSEEIDTINAARFDRRKNQSSDSSKSQYSRSSSGGSSESPRYYKCYYCQERHEGGWQSCAVRKKNDPNWRPTRSGTSKGKKDFQ